MSRERGNRWSGLDARLGFRHQERSRWGVMAVADADGLGGRQGPLFGSHEYPRKYAPRRFGD
jgi:hypothetical protein